MSYTATATEQKARPSITTRGGNKLFLITGGRDEKGLTVWHYVRVPSIRQAGFSRAIMSGHVDFKEFGEVVLSGYGDAPSDEIRARIEAEEG